MKLGPQDQRHFDAAEGWLGLGDWKAANEELDRITPEIRGHPVVLYVRWQVYAKAAHWELAVEVARAISKLSPEIPFGWLHTAYALHEMKRTQEAKDVLLPIVEKFPDHHVIRYNLACYACQLGDLKGAMEWLSQAIDLAGKADVRAMALEDPDLEPLWAEIGTI